MIHLRLSVQDVGRMRFAFSPLAEVAECAYMVVSGRIHSPHRPWYLRVWRDLARADMDLLAGIFPPVNRMVDFPFTASADPTTGIEEQLDALSRLPLAELRADVESVWPDARPPERVRDLLADERAGARLAEAIGQFWVVAIEPYWPELRSVLDDDVAYRTTRLVSGGGEALLSDLHPDISIDGDLLTISKPTTMQRDLSGAGLRLLPSVFAWPKCGVSEHPTNPASIIYGARGVGTLWGTGSPGVTAGEKLGALIGRSRASMLAALGTPLSTSELAVRLGLSAPSVSQHLSILRDSGLVRSWRSGRRMLNQRTPLATSILEASAGIEPDRDSLG